MQHITIVFSIKHQNEKSFIDCMKQIRIETANGNIEFSLPEEWDELTRAQLLYLVGLFDKQITPEEVKVKMVLHCAGGSVRGKNRDGSFRLSVGKKRVDLSPEDLVSISLVFDFLFVVVDGDVRVDPRITRNHFREIRSAFTRLYGPDDGLTNLKYRDFADLQIAHAFSSGDPADMDRFISLLYRKRDGSLAEKAVKRIPAKVKVAILWFYLGSIQKLQELFPRVFAGGGEEGGNPADGQMRIIDALSKNDVTKKEAVRNSDLYEALYTMEVAAEQYEEMKSKK
jgi:hypothetical protein